MEFRVLGKLAVFQDGNELDLGAFRQRALLALLLTEPNTVFSTDGIIDALWGDEGSPDRQSSLWVYVSGLRKVLEPERAKRAEATVLVTRSPGYLIAAEPDQIDSLRFERLVAEGRLLGGADPAAASMVLGEALGYWQGRAFEEFSYESFAETEIGRLEALRQEAVEARIDADLDRGLARELLSELETLVRQYPLREQLTAQHMVALTRAGRQAEALRAFQGLRTRLVGELGIEPSQPLRTLEEQIITGNMPSPVGQQSASIIAGVSSGLGVRGYELREELGQGAFGAVYRAYQPAVGREVAIKVIRPEFANDPDFIRRFDAEAQLVARLEHPHIVPLYDYWREPDAAYLVMRLMSGGSLADVLDSRALDNSQVDRLVEQLGSALHSAHSHGVVHRDIKPDNILIDDDGNVYLSDFGIAMDTGESSGDDIRLATQAPPYASPEALERCAATTSSDIYSLGVVVAHALTGLGGEIESIRGALPAAMMPVVDRATASSPEQRFGDVGAFAQALRDALGTWEAAGPIAVAAENPYVGLRAFDATSSDAFFGRERLVERLVARLGERGPRGRFVAIVGPSGGGKSSVARAGLIPALREGAVVGSKDWFVVQMTPGTHPFEELEAALRSIAVAPPSSMLEDLAADNGIQRALRRVLPDDGSQVLLLVDQFEELFTLTASETAQSFLDALVSAVGADQSRLRIVITLRADFYDRPLRHLQMGELLREGTEVITPMTPDELERAITGPVEPLGTRFESGLVAELVRDVADRTGALPLLQYTLTELFEARRGNTIELAAYRSLGGVSGALVERAEGLCAQLGEHAHDTVRQVFLRLVTFGDGSEDTRRRVLRTELEQLAVDRRVLDGVLDTFGRHRLISFDRDPVTRGPTVEISHEALLREWLRLRNWIDDARSDVRSQRRLAEAMAEWVVSGQGADYLLRGGRLDELQGWASRTAVPLSVPEREFLDSSIEERDRTLEAETARDRRTADAERVAQKRLRQLAGAGLMSVVVAALAVFGISQWRSASAARDEVAVERDVATAARDEATQARNDRDSLVTAEEYISASEAAFVDEPELALLYGVEAIRSTSDLGFATEQAVDSVHWALQRLGVHFDLGADPETTVRSGPYGLTGVFIMSPAELIDLAETTTTRRLVDIECVAATDDLCGVGVDVPDDLTLRFGEENYRNSLPTILPGSNSGDLEGTNVSVAISSVFGGIEGLERELQRFSDNTGIGVEVVPGEGVEVTLALGAGTVLSPPDVSLVYRPEVPEWAADRALDFSDFLDADEFRSDFGDYLTDLMTVDGEDGTELQLVPINIGPAGLVYYAKPAFEAAGYEIPTTFDELVEISEAMVAAGQTPWCFDWESSFATGWPGAGLLESLVIRTQGPDTYDRWVSGDLDFASPEIIEAAHEVERLLFSPGFVSGGTESVTKGSWHVPFIELLDVHPFTGAPGPACMFVHQLHSTGGFLGPNTELRGPGVLGRDIGVFVLPPMSEGDPVAVTGTGSSAFASSDRPEVRALIRFMASPEWGEVWAGWEADSNEPFISSNRRFLTNSYGIFRQFRDDTSTRIGMHDANKAALDAGTWRFAASNVMPAGFASWIDGTRPGPYWQGMVDWVNQVKPIEEILADIDAERRNYE